MYAPARNKQGGKGAVRVRWRRSVCRKQFRGIADRFASLTGKVKEQNDHSERRHYLALMPIAYGTNDMVCEAHARAHRGIATSDAFSFVPPGFHEGHGIFRSFARGKKLETIDTGSSSVLCSRVRYARAPTVAKPHRPGPGDLSSVVLSFRQGAPAMEYFGPGG